MAADRVDALVIFGATGDLAKLETFPALVGLVDRGVLDVPVVGVAKSGLLRYVDGDLDDDATYQAMSNEIGSGTRTLFYLEVPPPLFGRIARGISTAGRAAGARVMVEKPFGTDLTSAQELNRTMHEYFGEDDIYRVDHWLGLDPLNNVLVARFANSILEPLLNRTHVAGIQITMAEAFDVADRGRFYDRTGAIRDVVQNHMLQVLASVVANPPDGAGVDSWLDAKSRVLAALRPLTPEDTVRGQYEGYLAVDGVAPGSTTESYVAVRLALDSWRWAGVPILIRAGKTMPVTATEVTIQFNRPPHDVFGVIDESMTNALRFRICGGGDRPRRAGLAVRDRGAPGVRLGARRAAGQAGRPRAARLAPGHRPLPGRAGHPGQHRDRQPGRLLLPVPAATAAGRRGAGDGRRPHSGRGPGRGGDRGADGAAHPAVHDPDRVAHQAQRAPQWRTLSVLAHHFVDLVAGLAELTAYGRARAQAATVREITDRYRSQTMRTLRVAFSSALVLELLATLSVALIAVSVGLRLVSGTLDLHTALVVLILAPEVYLPLRAVGARFHDSAQGLAAAEEVLAVLEGRPDDGGGRMPAPDPSDLPLLVHEVTVSGRAGPILDRLTVSLPPGHVVGVVGPSGAGKTTLLDVLLSWPGRMLGGSPWVAWTWPTSIGGPGCTESPGCRSSPG